MNGRSKPALVHNRHAEDSSEEGSILLLTIGFVALCLLLVAVVVDASKLYLDQQALSNLADGAARAGAQAVDQQAFYAGSASGLPLDRDRATQLVEQYLAAVPRSARPPGLRLDAVSVDPADDQALVVTLSADAQVPLLSAVTNHPAGVPVTVTARAHTVSTG